MASTLLRAAGATCSLGQMARALGVSSSTVEHWADPGHDAAVTLGDVLAMPSAAAEAVLVAALVAALAAVQARRLERHVPLPPVTRVLRLVTQAAGVAARGAEAAQDGEIDTTERRELVQLAGAVEREAAATRRDLAGA